MIRDLEPADVAECVEIVRLNWGDGVADRFSDEVSHAFNNTMRWPPQYFVYDEPKTNKILGFAGMIPSWVMHGVWDFIWINVAEEARGQNIGLQLTTFRISEVTRQSGKVINLMTQAPGFFSKLGFESTHTYHGGWKSMTLQLRELNL
jgi:N-acetylglutamate synthase-like GNAT family acetyltransferase